MTHPRSTFGVPEARPFGRHKRRAVGVRPQPLKGAPLVDRQSRIHGGRLMP